MNTAARHEAGHAVAIHLLNLADILRPGGAAVTPAGGGIVALDCASNIDLAALAARIDRTPEVPCQPPITAARQRPDLAPALIVFMLAGYGATPEKWRRDFGQTIAVRVSSDFKTAKQIIADLLGYTGWTEDNFVSEQARDALDRAVEWAAQSHVRVMVDRVAVHLEAHGAATWAELENIFSANTDTSRGETLAPSVFASGEIPLAGDEPGTVAGCSAPRCG